MKCKERSRAFSSPRLKKDVYFSYIFLIVKFVDYVFHVLYEGNRTNTPIPTFYHGTHAEKQQELLLEKQVKTSTLYTHIRVRQINIALLKRILELKSYCKRKITLEIAIQYMYLHEDL